MTAATSSPPDSTPAARPLPKWKSIAGWFKPTRTDALIYLGALMVLTALIEPTIDSWNSRSRGSFNLFEFIPVTFTMIAGWIAAIACTIVWKKLDRRFTFHALGWCVLGLMAFAFAIYDYSHGAWGDFVLTGYGHEDEWVNSGIGSSSAAVLGGFVGVFCVFWISTWVFAFCVRKFGGTKRAEFSRVKMMIAIAILLFVIAKIQTIFFPHGFAAGMEWRGPLGFRILLQIFGGTAGVLALFIFPSWLLTRNIRARWKWTFCAVVLGTGTFWLLVMTATRRNFQNDTPGQFMLIWLAFQFFFLAAMMLVQRGTERNKSLAEAPAATPARELKRQNRDLYPTFWSLAPFTLIIALVTTMTMVDSGVLLDRWDWELARKVNRIARSTDYQIQCYPTFWGGQSITVDLKENADPKILDCIVGETISYANINGLTKEVETEVLRGAGIASLNVTNSKITPKQLEDITIGCTTMTIENVEVTGEPNSAQLDLLANFFVRSNGPDEVGSLLRSIKSAKSLSSINIWSSDSMGQDDLDAIVEVSQKIPVELNWVGLMSFAEANYQSKLPMRKVMVPRLNFGYADGLVLTDLQKQTSLRFVLQTDIAVGFDLDNDPELFWDLVFAKGSNGYPDFEQKVLREIQNEDGFLDIVKKYHLVFGTNEKGEITDLFVPQATSIFGKIPAKSKELQSVETLSFDPMWIIQDSSIHRALAQTPRFAQQPERITGVGFEHLKNLKRLDLGMGTIVVDQTFLERIPNIEHLDIHFDKGLRPRVDFSVCENLKTLVYFGTPPKETAKQLSTLTSLQTVTVIDEEDGTLDTEAKRANLAAAFPNAKVTIVSQYGFYPTPPQKFMVHVKERAEEIRKERLGKPMNLPADR